MGWHNHLSIDRDKDYNTHRFSGILEGFSLEQREAPDEMKLAPVIVRDHQWETVHPMKFTDVTPNTVADNMKAKNITAQEAGKLLADFEKRQNENDAILEQKGYRWADLSYESIHGYHGITVPIPASCQLEEWMKHFTNMSVSFEKESIIHIGEFEDTSVFVTDGIKYWLGSHSGFAWDRYILALKSDNEIYVLELRESVWITKTCSGLYLYENHLIRSISQKPFSFGSENNQTDKLEILVTPEGHLGDNFKAIDIKISTNAKRGFDESNKPGTSQNMELVQWACNDVLQLLQP